MKFINRHYDTMDLAALKEMLAVAKSKAASAKAGIEIYRSEENIRSATADWQVTYDLTFLENYSHFGVSNYGNLHEFMQRLEEYARGLEDSLAKRQLKVADSIPSGVADTTNAQQVPLSTVNL